MTLRLAGVTLRRQLWLATWLPWPISFTSTLVAANVLHVTPIAFLPVVVLVSWLSPPWLKRRVMTRAYRKLREAMEARQFDAARALVAEMLPLYAGSRQMIERLRMEEAVILSREGRHTEALPLLASLDAAQLGKGFRPLLLNSVAWSLAHSGDPHAGVERARESLRASDVEGDVAVTTYDLRAFQLGTLGTALVLAGQADEGVPLIEQAMARGGKPREQAVRAFFLGEGFHALGQLDRAAEAWRRAMSHPRQRMGRARAGSPRRRERVPVVSARVGPLGYPAGTCRPTVCSRPRGSR